MKITLTLSDEQVKRLKKYYDDCGCFPPYYKDDIRAELQSFIDGEHPAFEYRELYDLLKKKS